MYLAGINFALHFKLIKGNIKDFFKDGEFKFYNLVLLISTLFITFNLYFSNDINLIKFKSFFESFRASLFQVVSITTTTGFCTENFELWPHFSKFLLIILMFFGGCAGSTAGGMKQVRIFILFKVAFKELKNQIFPNEVISIKIGKESVKSNITSHILGFSIFFIISFIFVSLFLTFRGYDIITSFSASIATLGNIGPGLAKVGAIENFNFFDPISKIVLIFSMLLGRLEIYSVLIFFYLLFNPKK